MDEDRDETVEETDGRGAKYRDFLTGKKKKKTHLRREALLLRSTAAITETGPLPLGGVLL